jgi:hypothetical protein
MKDFGEFLDEAEKEVEKRILEFRDPYERPWGDPSKQTETQKKLWYNLKERGIWRQALIAAKGAAKTFACATAAFYFGQTYPGTPKEPTRICIVANTDRQAKDAAGDAFVKVANMLGYRTEYFSRKKILSQEYTKFYVVDLDDTGFDDGKIFLLMVRSMESVQAMEGSEYDAMWVEEMQDGTRDNFVIATTRNRGDRITDGYEEVDALPDALLPRPDDMGDEDETWERDTDAYDKAVWRSTVAPRYIIHPEDGIREERPNPLFIAGMTEGEQHWMYDMVEQSLGMKVEDQFNPDVDVGVLYEPTIFDNAKNLGQATIDQYMETMDKNTAERHIHAKRISSSSNLAAYAYNDSIHRTGRISKICSWYDPHDEIILSIDFNVAPMCATLWQIKPWNDEWRNDHYVPKWGKDGSLETILEYDNPAGEGEPIAEHGDWTEIAEPDAEMLAQIDEFEIWSDSTYGGGTQGVMRAFTESYENRHAGHVTIVGDAKGGTRDTRGGDTDWTIIRKYINDAFRNATVIPGLESNTNLKTGETTWDNPKRRDTINALNATLENAQGVVRMCFIEESEYDSGGAAASVGNIKTKPDGRVDERVDRREGKEVKRTHFFDTVRYMVWYFTDGFGPDEKEYAQMVDEIESIERDMAQSRDEDMWGDGDEFGFPDAGGSDWLF